MNEYRFVFVKKNKLDVDHLRDWPMRNCGWRIRMLHEKDEVRKNDERKKNDEWNSGLEYLKSGDLRIKKINRLVSIRICLYSLYV